MHALSFLGGRTAYSGVVHRIRACLRSSVVDYRSMYPPPSTCWDQVAYSGMTCSTIEVNTFRLHLFMSELLKAPSPIIVGFVFFCVHFFSSCT